jgi:hypothetical protein
VTSAVARANAGGLDRLSRLADMREGLDADIAQAVSELRGRGVSWGDVGRALGVTRQSARQRYRPKADEA